MNRFTIATVPTANFDRLARIYRPLELLAYGRELERVRFCLLDRLRDCRSILVFGEGDGRCLARLARLAPAARIQCVDASPAMIAVAAARLPPEARDRVTFTCGDARTLELGAARYDAVITLFVLDCFTTEEVDALVAGVRAHLEPGARWLFADFVVPPRGWRRLRARLWLRLLYAFFRWQAKLAVGVLPESEDALARAGFTPQATRDFQHHLLRATLYRLP